MLLPAGFAAVLVAYFFYESVAGLLSRHVHETALSRMVGAVYLVAAGAVGILALV